MNSTSDALRIVAKCCVIGNDEVVRRTCEKGTMFETIACRKTNLIGHTCAYNEWKGNEMVTEIAYGRYYTRKKMARSIRDWLPRICMLKNTEVEDYEDLSLYCLHQLNTVIQQASIASHPLTLHNTAACYRCCKLRC